MIHSKLLQQGGILGRNAETYSPHLNPIYKEAQNFYPVFTYSDTDHSSYFSIKNLSFEPENRTDTVPKNTR
jgi:hypothetical protein